MAAALVNQLHTLMANMFATGLLDEQFQQLRMLQDESAPDFVSEVVTLFCEDGERIIGELAKLMDKPSVDFDKVDAFVHQLKGSSASVGAQKVKNTCIQFREFCQQKSRDGCLKTLDMVRNEFYDLRNKFQTMLQLEQQIQAFTLNSKLEQPSGAACSHGDCAFQVVEHVHLAIPSCHLLLRNL